MAFLAADDLWSIVLQPSSPLAPDLVPFSSSEPLAFPYVALPLVWAVDAAVGVFAADGCEEALSTTGRTDTIVQVRPSPSNSPPP